MKETDDHASVQVAGYQVANRVVSHIQKASQYTGVSFSYLMAQAGKESAFENESKSHTSSAAGLFQFTKGTWLELVKTHGADHGLGDLADSIHRTAKGDYAVTDATTRQQILDLRRDPRVASLMAGEYAKDNKTYLEHNLGRTVDSTDLYMAHFLGPGGASKILKARAQDPSQSAAALVPQAAHKNPSVFYDGQHTARSVASVYDKVHHSIEKPMRQYAKLETQQSGDPLTVSPSLTEGQAAPPGGGAIGSPAIGSERAASAPISIDGAAKTAAASSVGAAKPHHVKTAAKAADTQWPFETGQWPPPYVPQDAPAPHEPEDSSRQNVAYTEASQSADHIAAAMPPASFSDSIKSAMPPRLQTSASADIAGGADIPADIDATPLGKLFSSMKKSLFG